MRILRICRDLGHNHRPKQIFVYELEKLNIYEKLHTPIDIRPEENSDILIKLLSPAKDKNLPTNVVKFNRNRHTKANQSKITNQILKSINTKDKLYKHLLKTDINEDTYYYYNLKIDIF